MGGFGGTNQRWSAKSLSYRDLTFVVKALIPIVMQTLVLILIRKNPHQIQFKCSARAKPDSLRFKSPKGLKCSEFPMFYNHIFYIIKTILKYTKYYSFIVFVIIRPRQLLAWRLRTKAQATSGQIACEQVIYWTSGNNILIIFFCFEIWIWSSEK
jgi:hypothetical protein